MGGCKDGGNMVVSTDTVGFQKREGKTMGHTSYSNGLFAIAEFYSLMK